MKPTRGQMGKRPPMVNVFVDVHLNLLRTKTSIETNAVGTGLTEHYSGLCTP